MNDDVTATVPPLFENFAAPIATVLGVVLIFVLMVVVAIALFAVHGFQTRRALAAAEQAAALEAADEDDTPALPPAPTGPSPELLAAVAIAVADYARDRRLEAAPHSRVYEPGSRLFASRWVAVGRGFQQQTWSRR
jgi:hypothetical protein